MSKEHTPVLLKEILAAFESMKIRYFFDGTLGAGGHARALLEAHPEIECYVGCDRDVFALELAKKTLSSWRDKVRFVHARHGSIRSLMNDIPGFDGVMIDAGVSSMQLDRVERGFSFQKEGPLDMRMNAEETLTAEQIINCWKQEDLERILREYGEEPRARAIARTIVEARKTHQIRTTQELVRVIAPVARGKKHLHFATLTFQALRIAVNDELGELERGIEEGIEALIPGGRIAVISFHRLEDRIAKNCLRDRKLRVAKKTGVSSGSLTILTKKPIEPSDEEVRENARCRSAKLRVAEKIEE